MNWKKIFTSNKIKISDRVQHRESGRLGSVYNVANACGIPVVSVRHDDGTESALVPCGEYFKVHRITMLWARQGQARHYIGVS